MNDGAMRASRRCDPVTTGRATATSIPDCKVLHAGRCTRAGSLAALVAVVPLLVMGAAGPLHAQLGVVEGLLERVTDVSFYASTGGLLPGSEGVRNGHRGLAAYGVELLFSIGAVKRPLPETEPLARDSVELEWVQTTLTRRGAYTDTTDVFKVKRIVREEASEAVWLFELGLGYGQQTGFRAASRDVDLRGAVRELPSVSFYASYEPTGSYFGLRSGFMSLHALQFYDTEGGVYPGEADGFLAAALMGHAVEIIGFNLFLEGGYSLRNFSSVVWSADTLPPDIPRSLNLSGWFVSGGIQFRLSQ